MRKPRRKLLHLPHAIPRRLLPRNLPRRRDRLRPSHLRRVLLLDLLHHLLKYSRIIRYRSSSVGESYRPVAVYCAICRKIHGFAGATRPIITASHPVFSTIAAASSGVRTSPFPITGIDTASFTAAIHSHRACPVYPSSRVRACSATAFNPQSSAIRANSTQTIFASFHPIRNFTVNGIETAPRTALKISPINGRSRSNPDPPIASHHPLRRTPQIQIHHIEPGILANPRRVRHRLRIRPKQLRRDRMLILVVRQIPLPLRLPHPAESPSAEVNSVIISPHPDCWFVVKVSTLGTTSLTTTHRICTSIFDRKHARILDKPPKNRIRHPGHRSQHRSRFHPHRPNLKRSRHPSRHRLA